MRSFPAGLYRDVDEEVVAFVRKANNPQLVLGTGDHPRPSSVSGIRALSEDGACRSSAKGRQLRLPVESDRLRLTLATDPQQLRHGLVWAM
jgi:hypothetical protein